MLTSLDKFALILCWKLYSRTINMRRQINSRQKKNKKNVVTWKVNIVFCGTIIKDLIDEWALNIKNLRDLEQSRQHIIAIYIFKYIFFNFQPPYLSTSPQQILYF